MQTPNSSVLRSTFDYCVRKVRYFFLGKQDVIDTKWFLQHIFADFVHPHFFRVTEPQNLREIVTIKVWIKTMNLAESDSDARFREISKGLDISTLEKFHKTISEMYDLVMDEGIKWTYILHYFVFVRCVTRVYLQRQPETVRNYIMDKIFTDFFSIVSEKLEQWVHDHGGWDCLPFYKDNLV